ncbi:hypothetical protein T1E_1573 [Pseudomonas putida DOT-T1E]|uniref:Uncharacterized protein n=1 Tax=Pseudomonas putida (strain DOT-T1E) TaxID=1196325 RepID=I7BTC4_PSEPT|nr:hypothetical protein T1E_1573 [Pseudomonas putida DOT-T1E]
MQLGEWRHWRVLLPAILLRPGSSDSYRRKKSASSCKQPEADRKNTGDP